MTTTPSDFIGGAFLEPEGEVFRSADPSRDGATVVEVAWSAGRVQLAVDAAKEAQAAWSRRSFDERLSALHRFRDALGAKKEELADAIVREIGKVRPEARTEIAALLGRFDLVAAQVKGDLRDGPLPGFPSEALRWHPHGVVGVIGPFNFPLHLCHAHVIPALLLGNAVVMKPSETAPLCGIRYAEAARDAGLPPGLLNVVHGLAGTGQALVANAGVHALAFTGSWPVGRRISEALLDRPECLVALEMGGKNTVIVCEDADLRQAAHEIVIGGYLTTGQRCTCTDRVLVHRKLASRLVDALRPIVAALRFGDPDDASSFAGPLATEGGRDRLEAAMKRAQEAGAEVAVEGARLPGGFYRSASLHVLPEGLHDVPGYTDHELFGPDIGVELVESDDEAIAIMNASPYGFATSVFTASDARFDRYYRETRTGILNRNRSTNQASPRLPFGGAGRSGNFRPAGSFAPRNLAIPVAVQTKSLLGFAANPHLAAHLPPHDLDALELRQGAEEAAESERRLLDARRPMGLRRPAGGSLPASEQWLDRFYGESRSPKEKKPLVFDHLRSYGPFMVSVDDAPLSVLDGMSQTATSPLGFAPDALARAYLEGGFGDAMLRADDITRGQGAGAQAAREFADVLRALVPGLPTVCFTACGAEANEKAMAMCRAAAPAHAKRVLAFEGSFHGRTLLSLYASHNPSKRTPFEIPGYEVEFAPFPVWHEADGEPQEDPELRSLCAKGDLDALASRAASLAPGLLRSELESLVEVGRHLRTGSFYAVLVEPMQSEGGDRYASARFHRALRLLTRALSVSLIMDEVQCGFGLGGSFAWHSDFRLVKADGTPDTPDCVTFAKRAQVGVVLSVFADSEPTQAFPASLIRGRLHAALVAGSDAATRVEAWVRPRLVEVATRWGHVATNVRCRGFALAFDLPNAAELGRYLAMRFWRGAVVFGAGSRTVRYRLNASWEEADVDLLFKTIHQSLAWLEAHPGLTPPAWDDAPRTQREKLDAELRVREAQPGEAQALVAKIVALEERVYEPARRDSAERLLMGFEGDGVAIVGELRRGQEWELVGYALGAPLECFAEVGGPDRDAWRGSNDTLYSIAISVAPEARGLGLGRKLKKAQMRAALARKHSDGTPRYRWVSGRNRVGLADAMRRLNLSLGAIELDMIEGAYDGRGKARYYRQPLLPLHRRATSPSVASDAALDLAGGLARPFREPPASLVDAEARGLLTGPTITKITLCNYITPSVARAVEWAGALVPELPHLFMTSGRDETVDKALRLLRWHRKEGRVAISMSGAYVGHTTACARSISDPTTHRQGPAHFEWPRVVHPAVVGDAAALEAMRAAITDAGNSAVLGVFIEPIQERTGLVLSDAYLDGLEAIRKETGVPIVSVETAGAYYRAGAGPFATSGRFAPDILAWWTGGQLGLLHVSAPLYVPNPLTFVSTWDGDELSLIQMHHQLRAARALDLRAPIEAMDAAMETARALGFHVQGRGLYRVIACGAKCEETADALRAAGVEVCRYPGGDLAVVPALDAAMGDVAALSGALASLRSRR